MSDATVQENADLKAKRDRSPSFPFIALKTATKRLVEFENKFGRHPAPAKHSGLAWGMKGWSSQAQQTLAALKAFGLVAYSGSADNLSASITEEGRTYLRAQQDSIKQTVLRQAALKPKLVAKYHAMWGHDRPIDPVCLDELVLKGGFTEAAAKTFLQVYDDTLGYAGLAPSDTLGGTDDSKEEVVPPPPPLSAKVGDFVLVEVNGQLQFKEPKRVEELREHEGETWVFVEGEKSAVKMEQVSVQPTPVPPPPASPLLPIPPTRTLPPLPLPTDWIEERLIDDGGEEIKIHYRGEASLERYEFIRDYLDFKIQRMKKLKG